jgi:hypothetical protein
MSDEIRPALSAEQWAAREWETALYDEDGYQRDEMSVSLDDTILEVNGSPVFYEPHRHPLAALALHGMPFGFTREDVVHLEAIDDRLGQEWGGHPHPHTPFLRGLLARIAALLPPEDSGTR